MMMAHHLGLLRGNTLACVAAMAAGFLFDLSRAPLSPSVCGSLSGLYDQALLHFELFPTMHIAMLIGVADVRRSVENGCRQLSLAWSLLRFALVAGGMVIGGATLMPLGVYLETGWWFMLAAMTAGTLAGSWIWSAAYDRASGWMAHEHCSAAGNRDVQAKSSSRITRHPARHSSVPLAD